MVVKVKKVVIKLEGGSAARTVPLIVAELNFHSQVSSSPFPALQRQVM